MCSVSIKARASSPARATQTGLSAPVARMYVCLQHLSHRPDGRGISKHPTLVNGGPDSALAPVLQVIDGDSQRAGWFSPNTPTKAQSPRLGLSGATKGDGKGCKAHASDTLDGRLHLELSMLLRCAGVRCRCCCASSASRHELARPELSAERIFRFFLSTSAVATSRRRSLRPLQAQGRSCRSRCSESTAHARVVCVCHELTPARCWRDCIVDDLLLLLLRQGGRAPVAPYRAPRTAVPDDSSITYVNSTFSSHVH
jgi:hypothetical protein